MGKRWTRDGKGWGRKGWDGKGRYQEWGRASRERAGMGRGRQGCTRTKARQGGTGPVWLPPAVGLAAEAPQAPHARLPQLGPVPEPLRVQHPQPQGGHVLLLRRQVLGTNLAVTPGAAGSTPRWAAPPRPPPWPCALTSGSRKALMGKLGLAARSVMGGVRRTWPPHCTSRLGARTGRGERPRSPRSPHASTCGGPRGSCHPPASVRPLPLSLSRLHPFLYPCPCPRSHPLHRCPIPSQSPSLTLSPSRFHFHVPFLFPHPVLILSQSCVHPSSHPIPNPSPSQFLSQFPSHLHP